MQKQQFSILLVDDDNLERNGVRFLIERAQFPLDVLEAPNGMRALEVIRSRHIDILFTDVKMPYMDGLELSTVVHQEFPNIKIIIFSAYGEFEYAKKAMAAKAINYLLKPIDVAELESVMETVITSCQEEELLAHQREQRVLADKKLRWLNILTGKYPVDCSLVAELRAQGYPTDKQVTLLHMEVQGDLFAVQEQDVLACLAQGLSCKYEYINLYPNSSYLIVFQELSRSEIVKLFEEMKSRTGKSEILFLADDLYCKLEDLAARASKINNVIRQMFTANSGVLFMSDLSQLTEAGLSEVEGVWGQTSKAILSRDRTIILSQINELLDTMTGQGLFHKSYIHLVFCDVFGKIYAEYGFSSTQRMQSVIYRLSTCRSKPEILSLSAAVLNEVSQQANGKQDISYVVHKVKQRIHNQYDQDLSLDTLAQEVGLAPSYLSYVFKRETGENLIKYLTDYRMLKAKEMLDTGKYKIVQVAKCCGYENQSYFNRLFKNTYGLTPSQYREKSNG